MHVPGQRSRAAIAADFGCRYCIGLVVGTEATMFLRNGDAEQACAMQIPVVLGREFCIAIIGRRTAGENGLAKRARRRDDRSLLVVQPERLGVEYRRIQIDFVDRLRDFAGLHCHHAVTCVAATLAFRNPPSAALNSPGRSRLTRGPAPSSSTYVADGI